MTERPEEVDALAQKVDGESDLALPFQHYRNSDFQRSLVGHRDSRAAHDGQVVEQCVNRFRNIRFSFRR